MDRLPIRGGNRLEGSVQIDGAKNTALPLIAAALLSAEPLEIGNVPDLIDVATIVGLMQEFRVMAEHETLVHRIYRLDRGYEALDCKLVHCGADIRRIAA